MKNDLEDISFDEVSDAAGMNYRSFRTQLRPRYGQVARDIISGYVCLIITCGGILSLTYIFPGWNVLIIISGALLIGYILAYLALFIHEAGHFNIHPNKKTNDKLANVFLCSWLGITIKAYRKIHWQHHLHLGTTQDTETSYFHALTKKFLLEIITGLHLLRTLSRKNNSEIMTRDQKRENRFMLLTGFLIHVVIISSSILTDQLAFAIAWVAGAGIFFPLFATLRQILEHRDELALSKTDYYKQPHGKTSRLFKSNILSNSFGAAGFTRHIIHHWDPQISYTRLKDIETFLVDCPKTKPIINDSKTTYRAAFKKILSAS